MGLRNSGNCFEIMDDQSVITVTREYSVNSVAYFTAVQPLCQLKCQFLLDLLKILKFPIIMR